MAAPIVITCPACRKQLRVPAEFQGKKVRCKCGSSLRVAAKGAAGPAAASPKTNPAQPKPEDSSPGYTFMSESGEAPAAVEKKAAEKKSEAPARKQFLDDEDDANPYDITQLDDAPRCPFCAKEMESEEAIVCLHCGYNTQTRQVVQTKRVYETTFGDWCKWLGPGVLCVLAVILLLGGDAYFCFGLSGMWKDMDESMGSPSFSRGIRVWVSVMVLWGCWFAAKFAFRRLVLNPRPPEIEKKK